MGHLDQNNIVYIFPLAKIRSILVRINNPYILYLWLDKKKIILIEFEFKRKHKREDKIAKKFITDLCVFIYFINNQDNGVWILKVYPRNSFFIFERRLVANTLIIILLQKIKFFPFNTRLIHHFNPVILYITIIIL